MSFVRAGFILLAALVAALFAVENMHEVELGILPATLRLTLPVYLAVLGPLAIGLVAGWALAWLSGGGARARRLRREAAALRRASEAASAEARKAGKGGALPAAR